MKNENRGNIKIGQFPPRPFENPHKFKQKQAICNGLCLRHFQVRILVALSEGPGRDDLPGFLMLKKASIYAGLRAFGCGKGRLWDVLARQAENTVLR